MSFKQDYQQFIQLAIKKDFINSTAFLNFKKSFCNNRKIPQPTNADLRELYEKMIKERKIKRQQKLEKIMLSRAIRTQSGVAIVAVLTKPYPCPGKCIFCPSAQNMPKSYLPNEPAVMRAVMNKFNPYLQVQSRLRALELNGHSLDKIELIVIGGTFSYFTKNYQKWFIKECFRAANDYPRSKFTSSRIAKKSSTLKQQLKYEQKRNEKNKHHIVGLTLETRPDYVNEKEIVNFRQLGCTRVEIGVQSIFDKILLLNKRGHLVKETIQATQLLKDAGFKVNYHIMPGLYGTPNTTKLPSLKNQSDFSDEKMFFELFHNSHFQPDMLKIYPTLVIKNSYLYTLWKKKKYTPLTDKTFEKLIIQIKRKYIPPYVRIQRLVRDVPLPSIEAGPKISNLRQIIAKKVTCSCIRCREIKNDFSSQDKIILDKIEYEASQGKEIFLQFIHPTTQKIYALLRLRIPSFQNKELYKKLPVLKKAALIREVHTYGKLISIGRKEKQSPQHFGLGKKLIQEAEKIVHSKYKLNKIVVISGVGVRNYYRKLGYRLKDTYLFKYLNK